MLGEQSTTDTDGLTVAASDSLRSSSTVLAHSGPEGFGAMLVPKDSLALDLRRSPRPRSAHRRRKPRPVNPLRKSRPVWRCRPNSRIRKWSPIRKLRTGISARSPNYIRFVSTIMGSTTRTCTKCGCGFSVKDHSLTRGFGKFGGAGAGGLLGSKFGIAGGILGISLAKIAIIPAAVLGLLFGVVLDSKLVRCPYCDKYQIS